MNHHSVFEYNNRRRLCLSSICLDAIEYEGVTSNSFPDHYSDVSVVCAIAAYA
jgi:hypothetical protein